MLFTFNLYSSFLLIGFVQGIVIGVLLWLRGRRENRLSDKLLAALLILCCLRISQYMLGFAGWYDSHDFHTIIMYYFPWHHFFWYGPLIYFFFRSLTNEQFVLSRKTWRHLWPGLIYPSIFLLIFLIDIVGTKWLLGQELPEFYGTEGKAHLFWAQSLSKYYQWLGMLHIAYYLFLTFREYRGYQRYLVENFSDTEGIDFRWFGYMLYAVLIGMGINVLIGVLSFFVDLPYDQYWFAHFFLAVMIYLLSINGYQRRPSIAKELAFEPEPIPDPVPIHDKQNPEEILAIKAPLLDLMEQQSFYLKPQLSLKTLASALETSPGLVSKTINTLFEQNFNDFVNQYRVQAVKEKLTDPQFQHLSMVGIASECGFNSKATFNRAFKKLEGKTPREYLESLRR